jgi:hypothetical protein
MKLLLSTLLVLTLISCGEKKEIAERAIVQNGFTIKFDSGSYSGQKFFNVQCEGIHRFSDVFINMDTLWKGGNKYYIACDMPKPIFNFKIKHLCATH